MANHSSNFTILAQVEIDASNIQAQLNQATKKLTVGNGMQAAGDALGLTFQQANMMMHESLDIIDSMVDQVYTLDSAMTEFKKVSDLRGAGLDQYVDKLQALGQEVGRTGSEMVEAATQFRKNSYSDEDSAQLAKIAALYQNVSDTQISAADASSFLISQMKAFGIEADDAITIIDKVNATANNMAVGTNDLSSALEVSAAGMRTYGNDIDETIALITSGTEIMVGRSQQVARGLMTISANIVSNKDTLKELGIEVVDANGDFKSTYEVLKELQPVWNDMTEEQRQNLGITLAGKNQYKVLSSVMLNFADATRALEVSQHSAGSAINENAAFMDSLEAHVNGLKGAFEDFANNVIPRDLIAGALNLLQQVLNGLNTDVGVFITRMALVTGVLGGGITLIVSFLTNIAGAIAAVGAAGGVLGAVGSVALPVAAAIGLVVAAVLGIKEASDKANPSVSTLTGLIETDTGKLQENQGVLDTLNATAWADRTGEIQLEIDKLEAENEVLRTQIALRQDEIANSKQTLVTGKTWGFTLRHDEGYVSSYDTDEIAQSEAEAKRQIDEAIAVWTEQKRQYIDESVATGRLTEAEKDTALTELEGDAAALRRTYYDSIHPIFEQEELDATNWNNTMAEMLVNTANGFDDQSRVIQLNRGHIEELVGSYQWLQKNGFELNDSQKALIEAWGEYQYKINGVTIGTKDLATAESEAADTTESIKEAMDDLNESVEVSDDTVQSLIDKYPELASVIEGTDGAYSINIANLLAQAAAEGYTNDQLNALINSLIAASSTTGDFSAYQAALAALQSNLNSVTGDAYATAAALATVASYSIDSVTNLVGKPIQVKSGGGGGGGGGRDNSAKNALNQRKSQMQQILDYYKHVADEALDDISDKMDVINDKYDKEIEALEKSNDELEKQKELEEKLKDLETARSKQVLVFQDGKFQYIGDEDAISAAQKSLNDYNRKKELEERKEFLEKQRKLELESLEAEQKYWKEYKEGLSAVTNEYDIQQGRMLALQRDGVSLENQTWSERLSNLESFKNQYVALMNEISAIDFSGIGGGGGGGGLANIITTPSGAKVTRDDMQRLVDYLRSQDDTISMNAAEKLRRLGYTNDQIWGQIIRGTFQFAKGTTSAPGGLSLVGENGPEMRVLGKGDGVIPAEITKNLWQWGAMTPKDFMNNSGGGNINIENVNLPSVTNAEQFVSGLKNLAMQRAYKRA